VTFDSIADDNMPIGTAVTSPLASPLASSQCCCHLQLSGRQGHSCPGCLQAGSTAIRCQRHGILKCSFISNNIAAKQLQTHHTSQL